MYQTILGVEGFKKGMKLYFERHDGSAVTCDDFLQAMRYGSCYLEGIFDAIVLKIFL